MTCSSEKSPIFCNDYPLVSVYTSGSDDTELFKCGMWSVCMCVCVCVCVCEGGELDRSRVSVCIILYNCV